MGSDGGRAEKKKCEHCDAGSYHKPVHVIDEAGLWLEVRPEALSPDRRAVVVLESQHNDTSED